MAVLRLPSCILGTDTVSDELRQPMLGDPTWTFVRQHVADVRAWLATLTLLLDELPPTDATRSHHDFASHSMASPARSCGDAGNQSPESIVYGTNQGGNQALDERLRQGTTFERYEKHADIFPTKQWAAICLRYRDGFSEEEIAHRLHVGRTAINNRLQRARRLLEDHECKLRAEMFRLARNHVDS